MSTPLQLGLALAVKLASSLPGGINKAEGKTLAADTLTLASALAVRYAPPAVAGIVGAVLTWAASALASPPMTTGDALASLIAAVAPYAPGLDIEAAPVPAPEPPVAGTSRARPETSPEIVVIESIPVAESAPLTTPADG